MKILIEGSNLEHYYAKVHEAFRTGLRKMFSARIYGEGYPGYSEDIKTFPEIVQRMYGGDEPDLLIITGCCNLHNLEKGFSYDGLDKLKCRKALLVCDFWSEVECRRKEFISLIEENQIDYIIVYFRAPFHLWKELSIYDRLVWLPPSFDPEIFNNWHCNKTYDVGNLNAGITEKMGFYPERYEMHHRLLQMSDISYLWAKHPGDGFLKDDQSLTGRRFSEAINSCRIFVTSGNLKYRNFTPKHVEILASKACLFTTECADGPLLGLVDGYNYVQITSENFEEKIRYYLAHNDELERIAEHGYQLAMQRYHCYAQAFTFYSQIVKK